MCRRTPRGEKKEKSVNRGEMSVCVPFEGVSGAKDVVKHLFLLTSYAAGIGEWPSQKIG